MDAFSAFVLGLCTMLFILLPWYCLTMVFAPVSDAYLTVFCSQAITYDSS